MIHARRGRTGRQGRQRTGQRLHPSTAKPRRSEEPVETVLTTGAEADRAESGTGPLPSTEERRPTGEPKETATERSTGTDVEAKAGRGLNPFKRRRRGRKRPKQPKPLGRYFPIARVNDETVGLLGGVEVSVMEVRGVEVEQPLVAAFAGVLNALDFTVQLLVRQHPPRLQSLREAIAGQRPNALAAGVAAASDSLDGFLVRLEGQTGVVDRRFYAVCERSRSDELHGLISRAGFSVFPLRDRALSSFVRAALSGCAPPVPDEEGPLSVTLRRNRIEIGGRVLKTLHLARWPRSLPPGYLQTVLSLGIPMDVSLHVSSIATAQAARTLEWQKVKMESAASLSLRRGRTAPPEAEIALQDVARLRDQVHRGRERLFHASVSITIYADGAEQLKERELALRGLFAGALASLDRLAFRQHDGHLSTLPLAMNAIAAWRTLDTTSVAMLMPFAPPDLDTRKGTLFGLDLRSGSPVTFDAFDGAFLNANTVVMARSGAGKSFSMKLGLLRGISRGIVYYVIDPEGEYASIAEAAGGRVLTPGVPGHGLNPFVVEQGDEGEVLQRVGGLRRLIEVMVGERLSPEQRATLDEALTAYYTGARSVTGFHDFFAFLDSDRRDGFRQMASLLRPFSTGSLRHLLTDEGVDLLGSELPITVFNLRLLEPELRPAATLVCAEAVWGMASRDPRPRVLVVDEVWSIMQHPEGASFLVSLAKRARKHKLGLISITQDVQDFLGEDTSRAIVGHSGRVLLQNSAFKLLLQQDAAALAAVAESFDLSASDVRWLLSAPRGDGMLIRAILLDTAVAAAVIAAVPLLWRWRKSASRIYDQKLMQEKISRPAYLAELHLTAIVPEDEAERTAQDLLGALATAFHHYDHASGNAFKDGKLRAGTHEDPLAMVTYRPWRGRSVLNTREVATLWHMPRGGDEVPLLERSGARSIHPLARGIREGAPVGEAVTGSSQRTVHFTGDLLRQHHLYVAKTRMGKSTLMQHVVAHKLRAKAQGQDDDAIIVVDPHSDLVRSLLNLVPKEIADQVYLIDLSDDERVAGINLLDTHLFPDRDRATDNVVQVVKNLWEQWGPRMQSILEHTLKSLYEANRHPSVRPDRQYTILDGLHLLSDNSFRKRALSKVSDPYLVRWWARDFREWHRQYRADAVAPVQTRLAYYASSKRARAILGQPASTLDLYDIVRGGRVLFVNTAQGQVGRDVAALVGGTLLNLVDGVIRSQEALPAQERKRVTVVVDEMQAIPGADYEAMLSELGKFGASFVMATQSLTRLEDLSRTLRETIFSNIGCLVSFQVSASDARYLTWELDRDQVTEEDLTSLPVHHCYVRATVGGDKLPTFSMALRPPDAGDETAAEAVLQRVSEYTLSRSVVTTRLEEEAEKYVRAFRRDVQGVETVPIDEGDVEDASPDGNGRGRRQRRSRRTHEPDATGPDGEVRE